MLWYPAIYFVILSNLYNFIEKMFSVDHILRPNKLKTEFKPSTNGIDYSKVICSCCLREIRGSNKPTFKSFSIAICTFCRNYYRKHCLLFGHRVENSSRYQLCHKYMLEDKMVCKKLPDWIIKTLSRNKFKQLPNKEYFWSCRECQSDAKCAQDLLENQTCPNNHFWVRKRYNNSN